MRVHVHMYCVYCSALPIQCCWRWIIENSIHGAKKAWKGKYILFKHIYIHVPPLQCIAASKYTMDDADNLTNIQRISIEIFPNKILRIEKKCLTLFGVKMKYLSISMKANIILHYTSTINDLNSFTSGVYNMYAHVQIEKKNKIFVHWHFDPKQAFPVFKWSKCNFNSIRYLRLCRFIVSTVHGGFSTSVYIFCWYKRFLLIKTKKDIIFSPTLPHIKMIVHFSSIFSWTEFR